MLPLGVIALIASVQSVDTATNTHREEFQGLTAGGARWLARGFNSDRSSLAPVIDAVAGQGDVAGTCSRARAIMQGKATPRSFAVFDASGAIVCATPRFLPGRPTVDLIEPVVRLQIDDDTLQLIIPSRTGSAVGLVQYDVPTLKRLSEWLLQLPGVREVSLETKGRSLRLLVANDRDGGGNESFATRLDGFDLDLQIITRQDRFDTAQLLLTLVPILMWAAAALIGFFVVDRLLVGPLGNLSVAVSRHRSGLPFAAPKLKTPATEISELANVFTTLATAQQTHEDELSHALERQTQLTREVHHRVKNNLQVIASLISLHSRASQDPAALDAYSAIQRRVDALSIVHRNHYSRLDEGGTMELKPMLSELIANLRASTVSAARITLTLEPMRTSLDGATTLAFLITELAEMSLLIDATAPIEVSIEQTSDLLATLKLCSRTYTPGDDDRAELVGRYERVLTGLSRQMRQPLNLDPEHGCYALSFPVAPHEKLFD